MATNPPTNPGPPRRDGLLRRYGPPAALAIVAVLFVSVVVLLGPDQIRRLLQTSVGNVLTQPTATPQLAAPTATPQLAAPTATLQPAQPGMPGPLGQLKRGD